MASEKLFWIYSFLLWDFFFCLFVVAVVLVDCYFKWLTVAVLYVKVQFLRTYN